MGHSGQVLLLLSYSSLWKRGGGTDRTCLAILYNGQALYATNAGKLNGLAPEAYIQPQDNLLDNGYFEINQQNKAEYTGATYTIDRWQMSIAHGKLNVNDGYVTLTNTSETGAQYFRQPFEILFQEGDVLTLAVMLRGSGQGQLFLGNSATGANIGGGLSFTPTDSWKVYIKTIKIGSIIPKYFTLACVGQNARFDIKCAKTEYGPYFTGWPVWNYALELAKCQRYYFNTINKDNYAYITMAAVARTNNRLMAIVNAPVSMRIRPTPKIVGKIIIRRYNAVTIKEINENIASINCYSSLPWNLSLDITLTDGTTPFVAGEYYNLIIENMTGNYLEFNANL